MSLTGSSNSVNKEYCKVSYGAAKYFQIGIFCALHSSKHKRALDRELSIDIFR